MEIRSGPFPLNRGQRLVAAALLEACGRCPCHLVGGALRDSLLHRFSRDLDAVVAAGRGAEISAQLAETMKARQVLLGGDRFASYRLVGRDFTLDIWDRGHQSLISDLRRRDFTVNAMALDPASGICIDPFLGLADLRARRLRATTERSFSDDPLRVLRLARLGSELDGYLPAPGTLSLARRSVLDLKAVAAERIRDELLSTLRAPRLLRAIELLSSLSLLPWLWDPVAADTAVGDRAQEATARLLARASELKSLRPAAAPLRDQAAVMVALLCLAHAEFDRPAAAAAAGELLRKGYVTRTLARAASRLVAAESPPQDLREARWYIHQAGADWPAALCLLELLDGSPEALRRWRDAARLTCQAAAAEEDALLHPATLVRGDDLLKMSSASRGEWIGRILAAVRRAQVEGLVSTRRQALRMAERLLRSRSADD